MIREELARYKTVTGYDLGKMEKDYFQNLILAILFSHTHDELVFKGGTCLQKVYGIRRFSEDLDFSYTNKREALLKIVAIVVKELALRNFPARLEDGRDTRFGFSTILNIDGILFDGSPRSRCRITLDIRYADIIKAPYVFSCEPVYVDLPRYMGLAMCKEEIAAEKIRAILTRNQARDVYDLYRLAGMGVVLDIQLVDTKLVSYDRHFEKAAFETALREKEVIWKIEMSLLLPTYPPFDECKDVLLSWVA